VDGVHADVPDENDWSFAVFWLPASSELK